MQLIITGVHQRTAPLALREQLAFSQAQIPAALQALHEYAAEGFILSTCNRVEIYGLVGEGEQHARMLRHFLAEWKQLAPEDVLPHTYSLTGSDAVRHVFRLAAGLDSMVLGEDQIMGQLKGAMAAAQEAGLLSSMLYKLLQGALAAGKLVRSQTGLARAHLSVVSVALGLARQSFGTLADKRVLVVGAGRMAELALKHLEGQELLSKALINRNPGRAEQLAARYGAIAWDCDELEQALRASDVVISCTAAPHAVIEAALVARAMAGRTQPLLLLDVAVPRDIDRQAGTLPNVHLYDVDDMQAICDANRVVRAGEVSKAEALVEAEIVKFMEWWATQHVVPTIRALREHAEAIREAELQRTLARLPQLSSREQQAIQALSTAIVNKLLHQPIATLKDPHVGGQLAEAVQQLFQLP